MLAVTYHLLYVPRNVLQKDSPYELPRDWSEADQAVVPWDLLSVFSEDWCNICFSPVKRDLPQPSWHDLSKVQSAVSLPHQSALSALLDAVCLIPWISMRFQLSQSPTRSASASSLNSFTNNRGLGDLADED